MLNDYTVLIEHLGPVNSCEIAAGGDFIVVEALDKDDARDQAAQMLYDQGFNSDEFRIIDVVSGIVSSLDEFWEERAEEDARIAEDQMVAEEERAWENYISDNYDAEADEWMG